MAKIRKLYDDAIKPDGSKQTIYPITSTRAVYTPTNVTIDGILNEGYRFGGVVKPNDSPDITDQRVFYAASIPGIYSAFGNIAVDGGEAIFLMFNGTSWVKGIFGGASSSNLSGFKSLESINDLPLEKSDLGYLIKDPTIPEGITNEFLYVWVGENGDTLGGLYQKSGQLRGASAYEIAVRNGYEGTEEEWLNDPITGIKGISVQSFELIGNYSSDDSATNIYKVTLSNNETLNIPVKNGKGIVSMQQTTTSQEDEGINVVTVTLSDGTTATFQFKNGKQGNTGSSIDYPYELVNNLTTDDATKGLSAAQGVVLHSTVQDCISRATVAENKAIQLTQEIDGIHFQDVFAGGGNIRTLPVALQEGDIIMAFDGPMSSFTLYEDSSDVEGTVVYKAALPYTCLTSYTRANAYLSGYTDNVTLSVIRQKGTIDTIEEYIAASTEAILKNNTLLKQEITVSPAVTLPVTSVSNLQPSSTRIQYAAGSNLYYTRIYQGQTVRGSWEFESGYVRYGLTTKVPGIGVEVQDFGSGATGTKAHNFVAAEDGYAVVAFTVTPSVIQFSVSNASIGSDVYNLQTKLNKIYSYNEYITGKGETPVTSPFPVAKGKYKISIHDFKRGMDNPTYIVFQINVDSRIISRFYGSDLIPNTYYVEVQDGETNISFYTRAAADFNVEITPYHGEDIFKYNSYEENITRLLNAKKRLASSGTTPFVLLHFSDIHGDSVRLQRILQYYNVLLPRIDDILHTGDAVSNTVTETSFDFWDESGAESILNCIGNHDVWYTQEYTPETNYPYNTYFKPYVDNNMWGNIVQPSGAETGGLCYYYKDYSTGVRLIVLDYRYTSAGSAQVTWFEEVLADAITNSKSVMVAIHYIPGWTAGYNNSFDMSNYTPINVVISSALVNAVNTFIGNGGDFICWLTGHEHRDNTGYYQGSNGKQVILNIDCAALRNDSLARYRGENSKSQDAFNIISVNCGTKTLSVWRVGNDCDALQRQIKSMSIKYDNATLIS